MGNLGREVPDNNRSGLSNCIQTSGLVPTSPQKSPTLASASFAALPSRRQGLVHHPSFPTTAFTFNHNNNTNHNKLASASGIMSDNSEIIYYDFDDSSDCSGSTGSPEMIRRNYNSNHRKVARSQSEGSYTYGQVATGQQQQQQQQYLANISENGKKKTELCRSFQENGSCKYGEKCQFAHGESELRNVHRHAKYKTERCVNFHRTGLCAYGRRCHFIHHPDEENQRRPSVCIPEDKVVLRNHTGLTGSAPVRGRAVSLSSFPPPITIPIMQNFIGEQSLNLGSCGNSKSALSSCSYSSSPLSMSPGISIWHDRDPFGSSSSGEVFLGRDEESNEAPGPWTHALEHLLGALDSDY